MNSIAKSAESPHSTTPKRHAALSVFQQTYARIHTELEQHLAALTAVWEADAKTAQTGSKPVAAMKYALLAGGKRLRPCLSMMQYQLLQPLIAKLSPIEANNPAAIACVRQFALALELIHTYSLVHDDLPAMDNAALRRGKPSCHTVFGEAEAILAGDALLSEAFTISARALSQTTTGALNGSAALALMAEASGHRGMVGGQSLDLNAVTAAKLTLKQVETLHRLKTGALISAACLLPAVFYQLGEMYTKPLYKYAEAIGLMFQITDDILDHTQKSSVLGKDAQADAKNAKTTYLYFMSVDAAYAKCQTLLSSAEAALDSLAAAAAQTAVVLDIRTLSGLAYYIFKRTR